MTPAYGSAVASPAPYKFAAGRCGHPRGWAGTDLRV